MFSIPTKYFSFFRKKVLNSETQVASETFASERDTGRYTTTDGILTFAKTIRRFSPFKSTRFFNNSSRRSAVSNWCSLDGEYMRSSLFSMTEYERGEYHIQSAVEQFDEEYEVFDETIKQREEEDWAPIWMSNASEFGSHGPREVLTLVNNSTQDFEVDLGNLPIYPFSANPPEVLSMLPAMSSMEILIVGSSPDENAHVTNETSMQHTDGTKSRVLVTTTTVTKKSTRIVFEPKEISPETVPDGSQTSADQTDSHFRLRDRVIFSFVPPNEVRIYSLEFYNDAFVKRNYIAVIDSTTNPRVVGMSHNSQTGENGSLEATSYPESPALSRKSVATESASRQVDVPNSVESDGSEIKSELVEFEIDLDAALESTFAQDNFCSSSNLYETPVRGRQIRPSDTRRALFLSDEDLHNASQIVPPVAIQSSETSSLNGQEVAMLGNSSASDSPVDSSQPSTRPGSSLLSPRSEAVNEAGMGVNSSDSDEESPSDSLSPPPTRSESRLMTPSREAEEYVRSAGSRVATTLSNRNLRQVTESRYQEVVVPDSPQVAVVVASNPSVVRLRGTNSFTGSSSGSSSNCSTPQQTRPDSRPSTPSREAVDFLRSSGDRVASTLANRNLKLAHEARFKVSIVSDESQASPAKVLPESGVRMRGSTSSVGCTGSTPATPTRSCSASRPSTPSREAVSFVRSLESRSSSTLANRNLTQVNGCCRPISPLANGPTVNGVKIRSGCSSCESARSESTPPLASDSDNLPLSQNIPDASESPVDDADGHDIDGKGEPAEKLENLHTEKVNEDSMVAKDNSDANACINSFVEDTEEVAHSVLLDIINKLESAPSEENRTRVSETPRHKPEDSEDDGFKARQPTPETQIFAVEEVDAAPTIPTTTLVPASVPTSSDCSSQSKKRELSPAKGDEITAAAKRMEAYLANKAKAALTANCSTSAAPEVKTTVASTVIVDTAPSTEAVAVVIAPVDTDSSKPTSTTNSCSSESSALSSTKEDKVAKQTEEFLTSKQKEEQSTGSSKVQAVATDALQVDAPPTTTTTVAEVPDSNNSELSTVTAEVIASQSGTCPDQTPSPIPEPTTDVSSCLGSIQQTVSSVKDDEVVAAQKKKDETFANQKNNTESSDCCNASQSEVASKVVPSGEVLPTAEVTVDVDIDPESPILKAPPNSPMTIPPPPAVSESQPEAPSQESVPLPTSEPINTSSSDQHQVQQIQLPTPTPESSVPREVVANVPATTPGVIHNELTEGGDGSNTRYSVPPSSQTPTQDISQIQTPMMFATMTPTYTPPPPEEPLKLQFPHTTCDLALGLSQIFAQRTGCQRAVIPTMMDANMPRSERGNLPLTAYQYLPPLFGRDITQSYGVVAEQLCKRLEEVLAEMESTRPETPESDPSNVHICSKVCELDLFENVPEWFDHATTPCPSPVHQLAFDKNMRPSKPKLTKDEIKSRYRRPIHLVFPMGNKSVHWSDHNDELSDEQTVSYPKDVYPIEE